MRSMGLPAMHQIVDTRMAAWNRLWQPFSRFAHKTGDLLRRMSKKNVDKNVGSKYIQLYVVYH